MPSLWRAVGPHVYQERLFQHIPHREGERGIECKPASEDCGPLRHRAGAIQPVLQGLGQEGWAGQAQTVPHHLIQHARVREELGDAQALDEGLAFDLSAARLLGAGGSRIDSSRRALEEPDVRLQHAMGACALLVIKARCQDRRGPHTNMIGDAAEFVTEGAAGICVHSVWLDVLWFPPPEERPIRRAREQPRLEPGGPSLQHDRVPLARYNSQSHRQRQHDDRHCRRMT